MIPPRPYHLSEDEFFRLDRTRRAVHMLAALLEEDRESCPDRRLCISGFLTLVTDDMKSVLYSVEQTYAVS